MASMKDYSYIKSFTKSLLLWLGIEAKCKFGFTPKPQEKEQQTSMLW